MSRNVLSSGGKHCGRECQLIDCNRSLIFCMRNKENLKNVDINLRRFVSSL